MIKVRLVRKWIPSLWLAGATKHISISQKCKRKKKRKVSCWSAMHLNSFERFRLLFVRASDSNPCVWAARERLFPGRLCAFLQANSRGERKNWAFQIVVSLREARNHIRPFAGALKEDSDGGMNAARLVALLLCSMQWLDEVVSRSVWQLPTTWWFKGN